ncbi:MAG: SbcC/MukB-like Walker B domain-containing protein, partial [Acidimicrobiales bacterium]
SATPPPAQPGVRKPRNRCTDSIGTGVRKPPEPSLWGGRRERLTARTQGIGSSGEQAKLAHLPLFAATAAYYSSARADAPHLLMLDEAFAGIDDAQRGDCMGMLVDLELDMVLTNFSEWGCHREIPSVATYHLERTPGRLGVTALRFLWDGNVRAEDDPWLEDREAAASRSDRGGGGLIA